MSFSVLLSATVSRQRITSGFEQPLFRTSSSVLITFSHLNSVPHGSFSLVHYCRMTPSCILDIFRVNILFIAPAFLLFSRELRNIDPFHLNGRLAGPLIFIEASGSSSVLAHQVIKRVSDHLRVFWCARGVYKDIADEALIERVLRLTVDSTTYSTPSRSQGSPTDPSRRRGRRR